jgi:hypothetical protein
MRVRRLINDDVTSISINPGSRFSILSCSMHDHNSQTCSSKFGLLWNASILFPVQRQAVMIRNSYQNRWYSAYVQKFQVREWSTSNSRQSLADNRLLQTWSMSVWDRCKAHSNIQPIPESQFQSVPRLMFWKRTLVSEVQSLKPSTKSSDAGISIRHSEVQSEKARICRMRLTGWKITSIHMKTVDNFSRLRNFNPTKRWRTEETTDFSNPTVIFKFNLSQWIAHIKTENNLCRCWNFNPTKWSAIWEATEFSQTTPTSKSYFLNGYKSNET